MEKFNDLNTEGFNENDLKVLNATYEDIIQCWSSDEISKDIEDYICDRLLNIWPKEWESSDRSSELANLFWDDYYASLKTNDRVKAIARKNI